MTAQAKTSRRLMEEAIAQRSRCYLALPETLTGLGELACAILEASTRGLVLETVGKTACGPHWAGLPVTGFFRVTLRRGRPEETFYTFDSHIREAAAAAPERPVVLNEPPALVFGQRRKSLRLDRNRGRSGRLFVALRKGRGLRPHRPVPARRRFQSGRQVADISAGGLRCACAGRCCANAAWKLPQGTAGGGPLELNDRGVSGENAFWIVARVRHGAKDGCPGTLRSAWNSWPAATSTTRPARSAGSPCRPRDPGVTDSFFHGTWTRGAAGLL